MVYEQVVALVFGRRGPPPQVTTNVQANDVHTLIPCLAGQDCPLGLVPAAVLQTKHHVLR